MRSLEVLKPFGLFLTILVALLSAQPPILMAQAQTQPRSNVPSQTRAQQRSQPSQNQAEPQTLQDEAQQPPNARSVPSTSTAPPPAPAAHSP